MWRTDSGGGFAVRRRPNLRASDGVAMTEFALIVPVFLLIVAGMLGFGRALFYWIDANHLANETARWAVVDRNPFTPKTLQQYARDSGGTVEFTDASVCISFPDGTQSFGHPLKVTIKKPFTFVPIVNIGTIDIAGSATLRIERVSTSPAYKTSENIGTCS
jgi:Flp pilus assembly protein TadG